MLHTVKITSKRQITIPIKAYKQLHLDKDDQLTIRVVANSLVLQKAQSLLDSLAGSLKLPKKYRNKPLEEIIRQAKKDYFENRQ